LSIALVLLVSRQLNLQFIETSNLLNQVEKDKIIVQNALKEKEVLLVELQHRVKNNLAVIIGLLNMQREKAIQEESKLFMNEIKGRVLSISMVHDKLLGGGSFSEINLSEYVNDLSKEILSGYTSFNSVKLDIEVQNIQMDLSKAVPLGLIINEALTNSFKHAFTKESKNPLVSLKIEKGIEFIKVIITDNGVGFQIPKNENSLGLSLIKALSEQIDAELIINGNKGTSVELKVPYK
jgi:two-component sensor histidine kinase